MSRNGRMPRLQTDRRKLRPIAAEGSPPDMPLPLASFTVRSAEPPRVTTEVLTASHIINWGDYDDEPILRTIGYANDIAGGQLDS